MTSPRKGDESSALYYEEFSATGRKHPCTSFQSASILEDIPSVNRCADQLQLTWSTKRGGRLKPLLPDLS